MVVYAEPPTACHEIQGPPNNTNYNGNWIVLIARYNCSFERKVRMAQKAGYDAVIIHNVNSNKLGNCFHVQENITNTSAMIIIEQTWTMMVIQY